VVQLSDVVGGLLRDLVQSHSIADAYTVRTLEMYQRDGVLSHFPVARLTISQAQLTVRFAIAGVQPPKGSPPDTGELRELWLTALRERIVPDSLREIGRLDNQRLVAAIAKRLEVQDAGSSIEPAMLLEDGQEARLAEATLKYLSTLVESLPVSTRKALEGTDLMGVLGKAVRREVPRLRDAARALQEARGAGEGELDVLVTAEALKALPESQISQLTLTVGIEDVRVGTRPDDLAGSGE